MKTANEEQSKSLNIEKDDRKFPLSQFSKDQRKDAEKGLRQNKSENPRNERKGTEN